MKSATSFLPTIRRSLALLLAGGSLLMAGCGSKAGELMTGASGSQFNATLTGRVHGGQQPIAGSHLFLYAASASGYGSASTSLLTSAVVTNGRGEFDIAGRYLCTKGQQLYIVALGGDPGSGLNEQAALMAALGDCANINAQTFIEINEVTTVSSVYALAPFMKSASEVGTSSSNIQGLSRAFASVGKLVNTATGTAPGPGLAAGATVSVAKINSLADVIASCINSKGGVANQDNSCGRLFSYTTSNTGTPTDTISALLSLVHNPTVNVSEVFGIVPATQPFSPSLSVAPVDWSLAITYTGGGFSSPSAAAVDAKGNIWVTNAGGNDITVLAQSGSPVASSKLSGNGLTAPSAIALDAAGNAWVTNRLSGTVSAFSADHSALSGSPFPVGAGPTAIAVDPEGYVWVASTTGASVTKLASDGTVVARITSQISSPAAIVVNSK